MALLDANLPQDDSIFASDGGVVRHLRVRLPHAGNPPVLVDAAGAIVHPWEVELLRWPPTATAALQHGGYLSKQPADLDLWCNCAD